MYSQVRSYADGCEVPLGLFDLVEQDEVEAEAEAVWLGEAAFDFGLWQLPNKFAFAFASLASLFYLMAGAARSF